MWTRLRQNGCIVENLEETIGLYRRLFDIRFTRCATLARFQLRNAVIPIGRDQFLEVMEPYKPDAPSMRSMAKRGPHPWLLVVHADDVEPSRAALLAANEKVIGALSGSFFIHPSATPGLFVHVVDHRFGGPGPDWEDVPLGTLLDGLESCAVVVKDVDREVERYTSLFGLTVADRREDAQSIAVSLAFSHSTRLVLIQPKGEEGPIAGFAKGGPWQYATGLRVTDLAEAQRRAQACGFTLRESDVPFCPGLMLDPAPILGQRFVLSEGG